MPRPIVLYNNRLKKYARENRRAGNLSEVLLWNKIKNKQIRGLDFDRQAMIGEYIADFYCKELKIVIEIDGASHEHKIDYDRRRDAFMAGIGITVIRIADIDVKQRMDFVLYVLENHPMLQPTPAATRPPLHRRGTIRSKSHSDFGHY